MSRYQNTENNSVNVIVNNVTESVNQAPADELKHVTFELENSLHWLRSLTTSVCCKIEDLGVGMTMNELDEIIRQQMLIEKIAAEAVSQFSKIQMNIYR